jgi:hypothetical protein
MSKRFVTVGFSFLLFLAWPGQSQQRVNPRNTYERLLCVVPMVGSGTPEDPRRPMYAPNPGPGERPSRDGILAFTYEQTGDGRFAIVEFVARDRAAFAEILADKSAEIQVFEKGRARKQDIEAAFRLLKPGFTLDRLQVRVP